MREEEKIEKYLFDAETQFHKTMRAYFKTRSYIAKLRKMKLSSEQEEKLNKIEERFNWNIKNRMRSE